MKAHVYFRSWWRYRPGDNALDNYSVYVWCGYANERLFEDEE